jgi:hypothetical protein
MTPPKKLTKRQAEEQQAAIGHQQAQDKVGREFATVEEMLRQDALETPVPEEIAKRLQQSVRELPPPTPRAWWRKLFGT